MVPTWEAFTFSQLAGGLYQTDRHTVPISKTPYPDKYK